MRSIFAKILLWAFGTVIVSWLVFWGISSTVASRTARRGDFFRNLRAMQMEDAIKAYETDNIRGLSTYLARLQKAFRAEHYLTSAQGKDLVTGEDLSPLIAQARSDQEVKRPSGDRMVFVQSSANGKYRLIVVAPRPVDPWTFLPYYAPIPLAIALLSYVLAVYLATPLRQFAATVERFGHGDLAARVNSRRKDEIGELARAFDQMADRIQTLLTAERRLLQDISHELRSPLARLSFAVELARTAADREAAVHRMKKEVDRLSNLVGALLQVTRVEGDPTTSNLADISLDRLLRELVGDCAIEAEARKCKVSLQAAEPVKVRGDQELLRRALENILRNAIRHSPQGAPIEVRLERRGENAQVAVRDYGPGVPESLLTEIFKPFFRVEPARDTLSGGVGLGLAIAQRAVALHRGRIEATNMNPGLMVSVELPLNGVAHMEERPAATPTSVG